jgi:lipid A ethanolaminephosphotransferase
VTHDHLFHSVLGLMQVSTRAYQRTLDAYAGCGAP